MPRHWTAIIRIARWTDLLTTCWARSNPICSKAVLRLTVLLQGGQPKNAELERSCHFFRWNFTTLWNGLTKKNCQNQWFIDEQRAEFGLDSKLVGFLHLAPVLEQEGRFFGGATRNCTRGGGPCVLPQHSKKIRQTSSPAHPGISISWHFWLYHFWPIRIESVHQVRWRFSCCSTLPLKAIHWNTSRGGTNQKPDGKPKSAATTPSSGNSFTILASRTREEKQMQQNSFSNCLRSDASKLILPVTTQGTCWIRLRWLKITKQHDWYAQIPEIFRSLTTTTS